MVRTLPWLCALWLALSQSADAAAPLASADVGTQTVVLADAPLPPADEEVPWCVSAEDPRCAPAHGGAPAPLPTDARVSLVDGAPARPRAWPATSTQANPSQLSLGELAGVFREVERPPRMHRQPR
jgi:hypothetical protein